MTSSAEWAPYPWSFPVRNLIPDLERRADGAVRFVAGSRSCNSSGYLHGGLLATVVDFVLGHHLQETGRRSVSTVDLVVRYLTPVPGGQRVRLEPTLLRVGRRLAVGTVDVVSEGAAVAHASATYVTVEPTGVSSNAPESP